MRKWPGRELVERIRREVRNVDDCDIYWFPKMKHLQPIVVNGIPMGHRATRIVGCWAVAAMVEIPFPVDFHGVTVLTSRPTAVPILKLDGKYGNPKVPGDWLIYALMEADLDARGVERLKEIDDADQTAIRRRHSAVASDMDSLISDGSTWDTFKKLCEEHGVPSTLKEDRIRIGAQAEAAEARIERNITQELKDSSLFD